MNHSLLNQHLFPEFGSKQFMEALDMFLMAYGVVVLGFIFIVLLCAAGLALVEAQQQAYILLRSWRLATVVLWLVIASVEILAFASSGPLTLVIGPLIITTLSLVAISRFGRLATLAFHFFFDRTFHSALTPIFQVGTHNQHLSSCPSSSRLCSIVFTSRLPDNPYYAI